MERQERILDQPVEPAVLNQGAFVKKQKEDMNQFKNDQKVREIMRRLAEQEAKIQSKKLRHRAFCSQLVEIPEVSESKQDGPPMIRPDNSNAIIEEEIRLPKINMTQHALRDDR